MVLRLVSIARPSSGFPLAPLQSNSHLSIQARNDAMDLSVIELHKQIAWRNPPPNQNKFDIGTLDICNLEPFPKPRHFFPVHEHTPPSTDKLVSKTSYRTTGACLRCGSYDYCLIDCPKPARLNSRSNTQLAGTGKKVTITAIDDSSSYGSVDSFGCLIDEGSRYDSDDSTRYSID